MRRAPSLPAALMLAVAGVLASAIAEAAAPAPLAASLAAAIERVARHGEAAARLEMELDALALRLGAIDQEIGSATTRRNALRAVLHRTRIVRAAIAHELRVARGRLFDAAASWRRMVAALAIRRPDQESDRHLRWSLAVLAATRATVEQAHAAFEAAAERWRHSLRLEAWDLSLLGQLADRIGALERSRERTAIRRADLIVARTAHLRRQEAARRLARRWQDLEGAARFASGSAWTLGPAFMRSLLGTVVGPQRLVPPRPDRPWTTLAAAPPGVPVLTAPMLLDGAPFAGVTPSVLPVGGRLAYGYGDRRAGPLWRGVTVVLHNPGTIRSPRRAKVVFAGLFGDFGPLLILDHGDGYHALIAGLDRLDVTVGMEVGRGQAVGRVVAHPGRPQRLYIELRRHGEPVNPLPWLASKHNRESGSG